VRQLSGAAHSDAAQATPRIQSRIQKANVPTRRGTLRVALPQQTREARTRIRAGGWILARPKRGKPRRRASPRGG
jgi:hypothetical protein